MRDHTTSAFGLKLGVRSDTFSPRLELIVEVGGGLKFASKQPLARLCNIPASGDFQSINSAAPENMDLFKAGFDCVGIAVKLHVAAHGGIIDIIGEAFGNLGA